MARACTIKFSLSSQMDQAELMRILSNAKIASIQTANGLCVKTSPEELMSLLDRRSAGLTIQELAEEDLKLPDIAKFMENA